MASNFDPDEMSVETPTEYDEDVQTSYPIELLVEDLDRGDATYICQQLSLFLETGDTEALGRFGGALKQATDDQPRSVVRQIYDDGARRPGLEWHTDIDAER